MRWARAFLRQPVLRDFGRAFEETFMTPTGLGRPAINGATSRQINFYQLGIAEWALCRGYPRPVVVVTGFPRTGTSFLQSLVQEALPVPAMKSRFSGEIWPGLSVWKHTPDLIESIQSRNPGGLLVVTTLRPMLDALISWGNYDPSIVSRASLEEKAHLYVEFVTKGLLNNWMFFPFSLITLPPIVLGQKLQDEFEFRTGVALGRKRWANRALARLALLGSGEELFRLAGIGDSTGLSAAESMMSGTQSHMPNVLKENLKPTMRAHILANLPDNLIQKAVQVEKKALGQINPSGLTENWRGLY